MRYDRNFAVFVGHSEWYTFEPGVGYIPTAEAPDYVVEAINKYNSYHWRWGEPEPDPEDRTYV